MRLTSLLVAALIGTGLACGQGYYDDDIYFDASKAKKITKTVKQSQNNGYYGYVDYPAADTYTPSGSSSRSVDEYNRRGIFAVPNATDTISVDSLLALGDFSYTRRIERFHNPEVVIENPDKSVAEVYYAEGNPAEINIYVNAPGYWGYPYSYYAYDPFWGPGWGWGPSWAWGSPYWNWGWGPSWSWSWGWGPSWAWGPSWNWGWGPGWGWGGPAWGWAPSIPAPPAQGRPIQGLRPGGDTHYAGSYRRSSGNSSSRWNINNVSGRPTTGNMNRPSQDNNNSIQYRPGANGSYRNGAASRNENSTTNSNNSYRRQPNNSQMNNNSSSYRNNSGGSYRNSGSMGSSMRSSGGSMGGSMRGSAGGGGSRGGRR